MSVCMLSHDCGHEVSPLTYEQRSVNECLYVIIFLMVDEVPSPTYKQRSVNECLNDIT